MKRLTVAIVVVLAAILVQLTLVNGLVLPGGGVPDLVLLCVIAIGLVGGADRGLIFGFCAGLALDLAPPASQLVGQNALVLCIVGYLCGRLRFALGRSALLALGIGAAAAVAGELLSAAATLVLDPHAVSASTLAHVLPSSALYDVALSPLVVLLAARVALLLGASFDPLRNTPALEVGGSAAPTERAGAGGVRVRWPAGRAAGPGVGSGSWLRGEAGESAAVGEVGWLSGPATTRRARRAQARRAAMVTGATARKGAFWVGRKPEGLWAASAPAHVPPSGSARLNRFRAGSGVAGSARLEGRPGPSLPARPVHLNLAGGRGRRAAHGAAAPVTASGHRGSSRISFGGGRAGTARRAAGPGGIWAGDADPGLLSHGAGGHGVSGPGLARIAFGTGSLVGTGSLPGAGFAGGRGLPRIAFGGGHGRVRPGGAGLAGAGLAGAGGPYPGRRRPARIAFGTGGLPGAGRAASRGVPRISFLASGRPAGRAPGRAQPRIPFGTGSLTGTGRAARRGVPRIAFRTGGPGAAAGRSALGTGSLPGAGGLVSGGRSKSGRIAFGTGSLRGTAGGGRGRARTPRFRSGSWAASGSWLASAQFRPSGLAASRSRRREPSFSRSSPGHRGPARQPKTPRQRRSRPARLVSWLRRWPAWR